MGTSKLPTDPTEEEVGKGGSINPLLEDPAVPGRKFDKLFLALITPLTNAEAGPDLEEVVDSGTGGNGAESGVEGREDRVKARERPKVAERREVEIEGTDAEVVVVVDREWVAEIGSG